MKRLFFIILILISYQCNKTIRSNIIGASQIATLDTAKYAIIPYASGTKWIFSNAKAAKLIQSEIEKLESIVQQAVTDHNQHVINKGLEILPLEKYYRQYVATFNEKGEKVVWINFFCSIEYNDDWRKEIVYVDDGGNCYFSLRINLSTRKAYQIDVNGYA
jgi:hypothetical protein